MEKIKHFYIDCDATLTDGCYHVSDNGVLTKSFYTHDFWAIEELLKKDHNVTIITQARDNCIEEKGKSLLRKYPKHFHVCKGVEDKYLFILRIIGPVISQHDVFIKADSRDPWDSVFYIGDAENDLECIERAGWSACPADAVPIVKEKVTFVCEQRGGRGSVYEAIMHYLHI